MAIYHIWSKFVPGTADEKRRQELAQSTWKNQGWTDIPVPDSALRSPFVENGRVLPRVVDLFNVGSDALKDSDIVVFTNSDIGVIDNVAFHIAMAAQTVEAGWSDRKDFPGPLLAVPSLSEVEAAPLNAGTDTFFFRVRWWRTCRGRYPDMIIAREAWDPCMRELMVATQPPGDLVVPCLCWHENHGGPNHWVTQRFTAAGQIQNHTNAKVFLKKLGKNPRSYGLP